MEMADSKAANDQLKGTISEDNRLSERGEDHRETRAADWPPEDSDPRFDEHMVLDAAKSMGEIGVADNDPRSYGRPSKESVDDVEDEVKSGEKDGFWEEYREDVQASFSRTFLEDKLYEKEEQEELERKVEEENEDEEDEEEEEEIEKVDSTESSSGGAEKTDITEGTLPTESDDFDVGVFSDISLEILRDRHALIEKLREFRKDERDLKKKNRLLQRWVARVMVKKRQRMTPENDRLSDPQMDDLYVKKMYSYKTTMEEFEARKAEMRRELEIIKSEVKTILDEDTSTFDELITREKEVGLGLAYKKTDRMISVKTIDETIRRKVLRRDLLNLSRFKYIFYRHRYEDVKAKLHLAEKLGAGMTIMDYEVILIENDSYKEKLEEREKTLEKLFVKIKETVITLADYNEKNARNVADIVLERENLEVLRSEALMAREGLHQLRRLLSKIRNACATEKRRAGLRFAIPVVRQMEKMVKCLDELKIEIERIAQDGGSVGTSRKKLVENRTTSSRMTRVKSEGARKMRPGRC